MRTILAAFLLSIAACGESDSSNPPVIHVKETDKAMNGAMDQARATLDKFVSALQAPSSQQADFSLKARFDEGGKVEHMWVNEVRAKGDSFIGKIGNEPRDLRKVKLGQSVTIPKERVSDWMFVENGRLVGGTTLRVLRNRMSAAERKEFDRSVPFKID